MITVLQNLKYLPFPHILSLHRPKRNYRRIALNKNKIISHFLSIDVYKRQVEGISKTIDGEKVLDRLSFTLGHDDKVAFVGGNELAKTVLFKILIGEMEPDEGLSLIHI